MFVLVGKGRGAKKRKASGSENEGEYNPGKKTPKSTASKVNSKFLAGVETTEFTWEKIIFLGNVIFKRPWGGCMLRFTVM